MSTYTATISWSRNGATFSDNKYSRVHEWSFDGGIRIPASASPHIVPLPYSSEKAVDPEEAFVASLSSCHMLWFLNLAALKGFTVESYEDIAEGIMNHGADKKLAVTQVTLRPNVKFTGAKIPSKEEADALHHKAHDECFIARSVKTDVRCEPRS